MKKKMIYIGVPYTHPDKKVMEDRYKLVSTITAYLVKRGFIVFSPITYGHTLCEFEDMPRDFEFWNELCLSFLATSDLLVCVKALGWKESRGLEAETEFAFENGISILDLELENGEFNITELKNNLGFFEEFGVLPAPKSEVKLPFEGSFANFNNLMVELDVVPNGNLQITLVSFDLDLGICGPNLTTPLTNDLEANKVADFMVDYEFIWSNSIKYDIPLLESVLEYYDLDIPWVSDYERCVNTFVHHMPHIAEECVFEGDLEDGLDVCRHQINYCHLIHKFLTCNSNGRL